MTSAKTRICIVTGIHLWRNPRVVKEADTLSLAGFDVSVVSPILTEADEARDIVILRDRPWRRIAAPDLLAHDPSGLRRFFHRLVRQIKVFGVRRLGLPLGGSLGYGVGETLRVAAGLNADFYSCHLEVGLVAFRRLRALGRRCSVDFEDWYSRDLYGAALRNRPVGLLARLERQALHEAAFTLATSHAMADALVGAYGGARPAVVYNAFGEAGAEGQVVEYIDRRSLERPSLQWYSQTVGPGRGLELLFDAIDLLDRDFELHIRADGAQAYKDGLLGRLQPEKRAKVFFHPTVDPGGLACRLAEHDVGFALDLRTTPNRDLTIVNKIFQYLQAGCAIIATRTAGHDEAAALFPVAITLAEPDPVALARAVTDLLNEPGRLAAARTAAREAGQGAASWEKISESLLRPFRQALGTSDEGTQ